MTPTTTQVSFAQDRLNPPPPPSLQLAKLGALRVSQIGEYLISNQSEIFQGISEDDASGSWKAYLQGRFA